MNITLVLTIITAVLTVLVVGVILYFVPLNLWIAALFSGVRVGIGQLIGMRLRRVKPEVIVNELIKARKAGLNDISLNKLETHFLANGRVNKVVDSLISARSANIDLDFEQAAAIDLAGRDVLQAVKDSVNTKVITSPLIEAVARDGIQLLVKASITVRAQLDRLVGGAQEDTVVARVGQGIVGAIGSAETHEVILADPGLISEKILVEGLTTGTAFEVLSIDIADIDVGKNIGAKLKAEQAAADQKVAQAKAEEKLAEAKAEEQYYLARVQEMRAKLIDAESQVPLAISDAFRVGNLGIMDYYRYRNIEADTRMRTSLADIENRRDEDDEP
ncbi:MAG: flotillin-like protein FloA [Bacteroidota bacterium]